MRLRHVFFLIFFTIFVSCKEEYSFQLTKAETLLFSRPDSALVILDSVPFEKLKTREDRAQYALLMSAALDKNYIDVASDSLIKIAVDYYSGKQCGPQRMQAWYYQGLVLKNAQKYIPSMLCFEKAETDAQKLEDYFYLGLIYRNKALLYSFTNNNPAAIEGKRLSVDCFKKADAPRYAAYAKASLAIDYSNNKDFSKADSLLLEIIQQTDDPLLKYQCVMHRAGILVKQDTLPLTAIEMFRECPKRLYGYLDYAYLAQAFDMTGQRDSADYWMAEAYIRCQNREQTATLDYMASRLQLNRRNFESAFYLVDHAASVQDSLTRMLLEQSISAAQRDYYKNEASLREERIHRLRERTMSGIVMALIALALFVSVVVSQNRKKDRLLQEQMARLALEERDLDRVKKENAQLVGSLFNDKIGRLEELNDLYFQGEDEKQKERVFRQIKHAVASMQKDQTLFPSLEKDLDRYCNGIMSKFRQQVPSIKRENQLHTVMLFFAGFSYPVVQLIMNKPSVESLKMDRSRFRKEILSANAADADLFLKMLDMKKRPQDGTNESC